MQRPFRHVLTALFLAPALFMAAPVSAQQGGDVIPPMIERFRPLPFHQIASLVGERYSGRILAAQTRQPNADERALGTELVYEFRLLTPRRSLLIIRIDARTGRFLDVAGRGQIEARVTPGAGALARDR